MKRFKENTIIWVLLFLLIGTAFVFADEWQFLGLSDMEIISIETHSFNSDYIYAGTNYNGLYMTSDGGNNWHNKIASNVPISFIGTDPHSPPTLFAIVSDSWSAGLYNSADNGESWHLINNFINPRRLGFDAETIGCIYLCYPNGIFTSVDYGYDYQDAINGLPDLNIIDVMGHGANGNEGYAVGETFIAHTTSFGYVWEDLGGLFGLEDYNPSRIAFEPNGPDTLYVACWAYLARSFDGGDSWEYTATSTTANKAIACEAFVPGKIYVGSDGGGVLMSDDAGASFISINDNLGDLRVHCLTIDSDGRLLAGTGSGIYYYDIMIDVAINDHLIPDQLIINQNYPNPFNASTTIQYSLPIETDVIIDIYDIQGRRVTTLIEERQPAGSHQVVWNAKDISSGIYLYKIKAGNCTLAKQCIVLK